MIRGCGIIAVVTLVATAVTAASQEADPLRAHHERAQSFQLAGELERAETEYRTQVLPRALRRLGNLSGAEGRADEAIELLDEAARHAPADVEITIDLAVAWLRKGDLMRAGGLAQMALSAAPSNARARSLLARIRLLAGDAAQAAVELRKALDQEARFDTAYALALASLHLRRLETARALFDQMTVANATPELLVLIGRAYLESEYPALAAEQFRLALARDPRARHAHYYLGLACLAGAALDRIATARAEFEAQLRVTPEHLPSRAALDGIVQGHAQTVAATRGRVLLELLPTAASIDEERRRRMRAQLASVLESAWHNLAVIHARRGETEAAAEARRRAAGWSAGRSRASGPAIDADAAIRTAEALVQAGDVGGAERALSPVLERLPELPAGLRVLGLIRAAQGREDEAEALLRRASDGDATEHAVLVTLASVYVARGAFQRAIAALDRAPAGVQETAVPIRLRAYLGLGRLADARALVPEVARRAGPDQAAGVAEALLARDLVDDAEALIDKVRERGQSSARLFLASARLRLRRNDAPGAEALLSDALTLDPGSVEALRLLAQIASQGGDDARAADLLLRASGRAPDSPELLRELAEASARAARPEEALAAARRLNALRPDDVGARHLLAVALLQNQNWREAIEILDSPPAAAARDPRWALALGMAQFGRRDYEAARKSFERALMFDPEQAEAHYHLGLIAREQGRTTEAIDTLSTVIAGDRAHPSAHMEIGKLYLLTGDLGRARRHLECAVVLNPGDPAPHYQLGLLHRRSGDLERARAEMQQFQEKREKVLAGSGSSVVKDPTRKGGC